MNIICVDVEIFPNFGMVGILDPVSGKTRVFSTEPGIGEAITNFRQFHAANIDRIWVGFNSLHYDNYVLQAILNGCENPDYLFTLSNNIINVKPAWHRRESAGGELAVDLMALNGGIKKNVGSLKAAACKLDAESLQELPFPFDHVLTHNEMVEVANYNGVDLRVTAKVLRAQEDKVRARLALAEEYGLPAIASAADSKLAELIKAKQLFGSSRPHYPKAKEWSLQTDEITSRFAFQTQSLQDLLTRIPKLVEFKLEETPTADGIEKRIARCEFSDQVKVNDVTFTVGFGGFHSQDEPGIFVADGTFALLDVDLDSCYPAIILNNEIVPEHLPKDGFLSTYASLREKRLEAKNNGQTDLSNGLKVAINSIFGKCGSPYSWLCDPSVVVRTTLLGQLTALSLIDELSTIPGVEVISGNTDGMTLKVRRELVDEVKAKLNAATEAIGMTLSWEEYRLIARRDINNYIAVPSNGGPVKRKGAYGHNWEDLGKKAVNRIVKDAAVNFFVSNTPVEQTIRGCTDICAFVDYFQAQKQYTIVDSAGNDHGRIARWYIGTSGVKLQKKNDDKLTQLVESGAVVIADLPQTFPSDVNFDHYIALSDKLVKAITEPDLKIDTTIPIADLSQEERTRLKVKQDTTEADLERCGSLDLTKYHADWVNVVAGNPHDTMKRLLIRLWISQHGTLSFGDLMWVADQLDEAERVLSTREKRGLAKWVVNKVSPFPRPQTVAEHVARAMRWAEETVTPNKKPRKVVEYGKLKRKDVYKTACAICAACIRNRKHLSEEAICRIIVGGESETESNADPEAETEADPEPSRQDGEPKDKPKPPPSAIWVDAGAWDEAALPKRRWVAPGYLLRGSVTLVTGPPGGFKSTLVLSFGCSIALKVKHGWFRPEIQGPVVIYNAEDNEDEQRRRLSAALRHFNATPADVENKLIRIGPRQVGTLLRRNNEGVIEFSDAMNGIEEVIRFYRPVCFIADPLSELHEEEENDNTSLRTVIAMFRSHASDHDLATCLVHHTRKGSSASPGDLDTARGASSIVGAARTVFTVTGMSEADAQALGVPADLETRASYVRLDYAKANYAKLRDAEWFQKKPYTLANGETVPAAEPWTPPAAKVATPSDLAALAMGIQLGTEGMPWSPKLSKDARSVSTLLAQFGFHGDAQKDVVRRLQTECGMETGKWRNTNRYLASGLRIDGKPAVDWES